MCLCNNPDGRLLGWQVRCEQAGVVFLAIWRLETSNSATLILKHRVTIPEGMEDSIVVSYIYNINTLAFMSAGYTL